MKQSAALALAILFLLALGCRTGVVPEAEQPDGVVEVSAEPSAKPTEIPASDPQWRTVGLMLDADAQNRQTVTVLANVPAGVTLKIEQPGIKTYTFTNDADETAPRRILIPVEAFFPNEPLETAEAAFAPHITFTTADGTEYEAICPTVAYEFPKLSVEIANETDGAAFTYRVNELGFVELEGTVSEPDARVFLNGETELPVLDGGRFIVALRADGAETASYTLTAQKNNFVTASVTVQIVPDGQPLTEQNDL